LGLRDAKGPSAAAMRHLLPEEKVRTLPPLDRNRVRLVWLNGAPPAVVRIDLWVEPGGFSQVLVTVGRKLIERIVAVIPILPRRTSAMTPPSRQRNGSIRPRWLSPVVLGLSLAGIGPWGVVAAQVAPFPPPPPAPAPEGPAPMPAPLPMSSLVTPMPGQAFGALPGEPLPAIVPEAPGPPGRSWRAFAPTMPRSR
jgi:hypothetical protein